MAGRLEGKVAIITGAASGIGLATARVFAREGARVAIADLDGDGAEAAARALPGAGHLAFRCDVTDRPRVDAVVHEVVDAHGRVDVLMNNAGVDGFGDDGRAQAIEHREPVLLHMGDEPFARMLAIHVHGAFYFARAAARSMWKQRAGSILNVSSIAGLAGMGMVHYATAKAALLGMTRSLARELGPAGIRVNAICPGVIDTPMTRAVPEAFLAPMVASTPLRRQGAADDIANCALYLACDESGFVTGQALSPNGGIHIA
ncbi:MAG: SDR family NAD(P)-dependent oxidoreductase [Myxococcota bacterium]